MFTKTPKISYPKNALFWDTLTKKNTQDLDYLAGRNSLIPRVTHERFRKQQMRFLQEKVLPEFSKKPSVLDLGCGPGTWAFAIADQIESFLGIDMTPAFIEYAKREAKRRKLFHLRFQQTSLLEITPTRSFDLIILGAVLMYINDEDLFPLLQMIKSSLSERGVVYIRSSVAPRGAYTRQGNYQSIYRKQTSYETLFQRAGFIVYSERDTSYTDDSLSAIYFTLANILSLGTLRFIPNATTTLDKLLCTRKKLLIDKIRPILDQTPLPQCYHFMLKHRSNR